MVTHIESLRALQARIRQSKVADRELDVAIAGAFPGIFPAYNFTASIDACVALMAAVLPGKNLHITLCNTLSNQWCRVILTREEGSDKTLHEMVVTSPERADTNVCLAFLDAIVSAVIAELEVREKADV